MLVSRGEGRTAFKLFVLFCLLNAYQLTNFNVSIDDEYLYRGAACHFADLGRWTNTLLRATVWPQAIAPTGALLIFGALFSISFMYVLRLLRAGRMDGFALAAFAVYATYPVWLAQLAFSANVLTVGVGVFCASWAALRTVANGVCWRSRAFWLRGAGPAAMACAVALGAYQSLGLMYLVIVLGAGLAMRQRGQPVQLKRLIAAAAVTLLIGGAISWVAARLTMAGCGTEFSPYGHQFIRPEMWLDKPWRLIKEVFRNWTDMYYRNWRGIGMASVTFATTFLVSLFICVRCAPAGQRVRRACWLLLLTALPALLGLMSGSLPLRTFLGAATALCCLLLLAHSACANYPLYRRVVAALAILTAVQSLYVNSVAQARGWMVARHDQALAAAIYDELAHQNGGAGNAQHPIRVHFIGMRPFGGDTGQSCDFLRRYYPIAPSTTTGASFFAWDGGNTWRILGYMNLIGYIDLQGYVPQPQQEAEAAYAAMPNWPAPGSVARFGEGFLVKLSPPTQQPFYPCRG